MKILIITGTGLALGIAQRLAREGHRVEVYSESIRLNFTGNGLYTISNNLWKSVQECKFIVSDVGKQVQLYKRAAKYNKPIIGCSEMTDALNADAIKEYDIGRRLGMSFPESEIYNDALGLQPILLKGTKKRYYIKYDRKVFTCTKPEWLAWAMYNLPPNKRVLLQEQVTGFDVSVVGWFNGLTWVKPFFYATPYSTRIGAIAMLSQKRRTRLTEKTIEPLDKFLKAIDYKGPVTVNVIANKSENVVKSIYAGLSAPCIFAMLEGLKDLPLGDFLNGLAFGTLKDMDVTHDYLVGVEVANSESDMYGAPIVGVEDKNLSHLYFHGAFKDSNEYMVSDETNLVYTAVAHGRDLSEASNRVYNTIGNVQFPDMQYITNLQGQMSTTFNHLRSWSII